MAKNVIVPALGMAQETAIIVQWLKHAGEHVTKGEPLVEIETDKARVEIEAPASGVLANVTAAAGDELPVGQVIARILSLEEAASEVPLQDGAALPDNAALAPRAMPSSPIPFSRQSASAQVAASPLAARLAAEHQLDLNLITPAGKRVQKADVLKYLQRQPTSAATAVPVRLTLASPKARRLAEEKGIALTSIKGTGPGGAVLAGDVLRAVDAAPEAVSQAHELTMGHIWHIMAERTTQSWTSAPHFYLVREVQANRLLAWREQLLKRSLTQITYTDLLVKLVAGILREHPRLNASWSEGKIVLHDEIHLGIAVAVEAGLVVPVIHQADRLNVHEIAERRGELVARAQADKLGPGDLRGGTFTISNLGMYGVDAFTAIINPPQVAILAVGRIAQRVVPVNGQPGVQPTMMLSLSCDHRAVDGARGAQFLSALAEAIEEPLGLLG